MSTKIHNMKHLSLFIVILLLTFSCKKKNEDVDLCTNSFKDIGETGVDCGGSCDPCPVVYMPNAYMRINGEPVSFTNKSITEQSGNWFLNCFNDTIQMQFNLGPDISVGNYQMQNTDNFAVVNGLSYNLTTNGNVGIYVNNATAQRVNGLFQVKFYHTGMVDTLYVTNGEFVDLTY